MNAKNLRHLLSIRDFIPLEKDSEGLLKGGFAPLLPTGTSNNCHCNTPSNDCKCHAETSDNCNCKLKKKKGKESSSDIFG